MNIKKEEGKSTIMKVIVKHPEGEKVPYEMHITEESHARVCVWNTNGHPQCNQVQKNTIWRFVKGNGNFRNYPPGVVCSGCGEGIGCIIGCKVLKEFGGYEKPKEYGDSTIIG